ncbi:MAG: tyrosine-type recombinase/integrase, partial [Oscillospiraceae bacterium]|nr:tyrosine-type recombinase/integrase [Oscillospiraceae bacterium]
MSRTTQEKSISYDEQRKLYYLYMDFGRDRSGRRVRRYRTFTTLTAARRARDDFRRERKESQENICDLTLSQWLEEWMRDVVIPNRAYTTVYGYQSLIDNYIDPLLGDIPLQELSPRDLQHYYAYLMQERGLGGNTVRHHHALLSAALHSAQRQDLIARCVTDRVEPPPFVQKETSFYTTEDLKLLYQLLRGHELETPVHLAGSLGLRREEICGLRWNCVDFEQRKIHIRAARTAAGSTIVEKDTKNRSSTRVLSMQDDIYELLLREQTRQIQWFRAAGREWTGDGYVILNKRRMPYSPNSLTIAFTTFVQINGLPPLTLHGLRHTFATVASSQGAPLFDIGKALGHSTPATTGRIYTHLADHLHADTLAKVAAALK